MSWSVSKSADQPASEDRPWHILVADDQPLDRAEAKAALLRGSTRRYRFTECEMAEEVLDLVTGDNTDIDCVVLDFRLPDREAPDVLTSLPRVPGLVDLPCVPVVVVTGGEGPGASDWNRAVLRAGAQDFIGKDWLTPASLTRAVEGAIERHVMAKELGEREQALRDSRERLQLTLDAGDMGTWEWDLSDDFVDPDERFAELWGIDLSESWTAKALIQERVHPEDRDELRRQIGASLEPGGRFTSEFRVLTPDGRIRWLLARGEVSRDSRDEPLVMFGLNYDLTERRLQQASLEQKNAELERFTYTVSHDLKSPLVTINGFLGLLKGHLEAGRSEEAVKAADRVLGAADRMGRLIQDLLALSRAGRASGEPEPVDLDALVGGLAAEMKPRLRELGGQIRVETPLGTLRVGRQGLSEAVENLLVNAVRYGIGGGGETIVVRSEPTRSNGLRLVVEDDGPGVPEAYRQRVFELFQRLDADSEGTGVGLAVVARVMEVAGGRASVESAGGPEGRTGARFVLAYPPEAVLRSPAAATPEDPDPTGA